MIECACKMIVCDDNAEMDPNSVRTRVGAPIWPGHNGSGPATAVVPKNLNSGLAQTFPRSAARCTSASKDGFTGMLTL
jgi:hypothetical protein